MVFPCIGIGKLPQIALDQAHNCLPDQPIRLGLEATPEEGVIKEMTGLSAASGLPKAPLWF